MPIPVLINAGGGSAAHSNNTALLRAFASAGMAVTIDRVPPGRLVQRMDEVAAAVAQDGATKATGNSRGLMVAGGGDGTLNCAATAAIRHNIELGVLPMGTRNHFAQDLGIPLEVPAAAATIANSPARPVDVGQVQDRYFLNNLSIGIYPMAVQRRDGLMARAGLPKTLAMLLALWSVLRRPPLLHLSLNTAPAPGERDQMTELESPLIFVGNNRYGASALAPQRRARLDEQRLLVVAPEPLHRLPMARLIWHAMAGELHDSDAVQTLWTRSLHIEARLKRRFRGRVRRLAVGLDGERVVLQAPLDLRCAAAALWVRAPQPNPD